MAEEKNTTSETEVKAETAPEVAHQETKVEATQTAKFYTKPLFIIPVVIAVLGLGAVSAFVLTQALDSKKKDNALGDITIYSQNALTTMVDSMDFEALEEGDDEDFIDFEQLIEDLDDTSEYKYLQSANIDLAGKTEHTAINGSFDMEEEGNFSFDLDIYTEYPDDYEAPEIEDMSDLTNLSDREIEDLMPLTFITGSVQLDSEEMQFESDINLTLDGFIGYLELSNTEIDGDDVTEDMEETINMLEDKVVRLDATDFTVEFLNNYVELMDSYGGLYGAGAMPTDPDAIIEAYEGYILMALDSLTEEDREIAGRIGPKLQTEMKQMINNYDPFTSINNVDPIREDSNSKCVEGRVDFNNLINTTEDGLLDMAQVIVNDKDYEGDDFETISEDITEAFEDARDWVKDQDLRMFVTTCADRTENFNTGFGMILQMDDYLDGAPLNIEFNLLTVDYDSDFDIEIPEEDADYTDEFNEYIEESGLLEMMSGSSIYDYDSVPDTSDSDSDFIDPNYDAYYDEYYVIFDMWLNGEITDEEYDEMVNDLDKKYGYDY